MTTWESKAMASLRNLQLDDTPSLEFLLLDALARWCVSDSNLRRDYDQQHAAVAIGALLDAADSAGSLRRTVCPDATEEITAARVRVVAGAHELASAPNGLSLLLTRLMPAAEGELARHAGDPGAQNYWLYCYSLLALAGGRSGDTEEAVFRGIMASFDAWNALMAHDPSGSAHGLTGLTGNSHDPSGSKIEAQGTQGMQVGDFNVQHNKFIHQNVETQVVQAHPSAVNWPIRVGDIPQQPPAWQPRHRLLSALGQRAPGGPVVRAVIGMRGTGKTQVAAAYARSRMADGWRLVAWVDASDTGAVLNGLADVAARLRVRDPGEDLVSAAAAVRHWLEAFGEQCLLVFDDASELDRLRPFVPAAGNAQVVITSSLQAAANLGPSVEVTVFSEDEALAFLAERTRRHDADGARELAAELGRLPLALAQAAAVIARQRLDYTTYLDRLRTLPVNEYLARVEADPYPRGAAAAVFLSIESAGARDRSRPSGGVLDLIAVLSATGVDRELLYKAGQMGALGQTMAAADVPAVVDAALAQLADASLLTFSMEGSSVRAHSLVTRVVRELRAQEGALATIGMAVTKLLFAMSDSLAPIWRNSEAARNLIEQARALYEHLMPWLTEADAKLVAHLLLLRTRAASFLNELGDSPTQGIEFMQPLLADYERILGADHPDTLRTRSDLAVAYQAAGRFNEAIALGERVLADEERILGAEAPAVLTARNNLAHAYQAAERADEAIPLYEGALTDRERLLGADHLDTLVTRNNLAHAYQAVGRADEAIPLYERTLAARKRILGESHPDTLLSQTNLAASYQTVGRVGEAIPIFERTLADLESMARRDHPDALALRNNLAHAYQAVERLDEAIAMYEQILADCERVLGADHPNAQVVRDNLWSAQQRTK